MKWLIGAAILAGLYGLHRLALWLEKKGWLYYLHKKPSLDSLGIAALELQRMAEPGKRYVLEARQQEKVQEEDEGGPKEAGEE